MSERFSIRRRPLFWLLGLLVPLILHLFLALGSGKMDVRTLDLQLTYLPLAERFLQDPVALFASPEVVVVAPGSFIYMALLGADAHRVAQFNLLLSCLVLLLFFDSARRLAGAAAAVAAAWLYAVSPLLPEVMLPPLSEPPFLFLITVWLWACVRIGERPGLRWPVAVGGVALLLATLTRATYVYWIGAALLICAVLIWRCRGATRQIAQKLLIVHLVAACGVAAYIAHNQARFNLPMVATGSGAALYFGSNPIVAGYEPPYYGMLHDHWMVVDEQSHLTPDSNKRLTQVAKAILVGMPVPVLAQMYAQKVGALLFFSQATLERTVLNERAYRVLLLVLACIGFWAGRMTLAVWLVGGAFVYQLAVHVPALYNERYSIGALELPLTLLAALGLGALHASRHRWRSCGLAALLIGLGIGVGALHQRYSRPLMPDMTHAPHSLALQPEARDLSVSGFAGDPLGTGGTFVSSQGRLEWRNLKVVMQGGTPVLRLDVDHLDSGCTYVRFEYQQPDGQLFSHKLQLNHLQGRQVLTFGTSTISNLDPGGGTLALEFKCPKGSALKVQSLGVYFTAMGRVYRQKAGLD
ncbi:MAG: glycosyltransferase family 39 protein [Pseudomonas sp.]|uniref:glycosyltransferase family 39 protein n=1 Tax=Pseudomonas sp. TaxID=306 RepID=UPI0033981244